MANVIIRKGDSLGKTRSEQERNLRKHWDMPTMSDEQLDKLKYIEKKRKEKWGFDKQFVGLDTVDELNRRKPTAKDFERMAEEAKKRIENT